MAFKLYSAPFLVKLLYPNRIWKIPTKEKVLYLTFDDGPIETVTPWVLDELKKWNASATFFCVGANVILNSLIYQSILSAGHSVGNHTFNHINGWKTSDDAYLFNVQKCSERVNSYLFRPPYGKLRSSQEKTLLANKMKIVMWDFLTYDFQPGLNTDKVFKRLISNVKSGSIIVFHDNKKSFDNLKLLLPRVLEHYTTKGFIFKSLS